MQNICPLNQTEKTLCGLVAEVLFGTAFKPGENIDWKAVYSESKEQTVVIPAFLHYNMLKLGKEFTMEIQQSVNQCIFQNVQNHSYHDYIHYLMEENNISYCILKGSVSAYYYPLNTMRQMGDVDFLVAKDDFSKAIEILKKDGFVLCGERHRHHVEFRKDRMSFEMHFDPPGIPDGVSGSLVRACFSDILKRSRKVSDGTFTWVQPNEFHHGLIMLLHMQRHLLAEGIGLRHLCDWAVFVNSFSEKDFQQLFQSQLEKIGLWKFAQVISLAAHLGIGLPWQNWMGEEEILAEAMFRDIFSGGNFGAKDEQRAYEGLFISSRGQNSVKHTRFIQAILSINQNIYINWPAVKTMKFLLPVGWVYFPIRKVYRVYTKKGKIDWLSAYYKSAKRKKLYQQLKLFEVGKITDCEKTKDSRDR